MKTSEQINEIATALAKAQGEVANPVFNKTNPHFRSKYADLSSVLNVVRPALSKNNISIMQMTNIEEAGVVLYTRLTHTSGQWIESVYPVTASGKHQEIAAALTYAKRLSLSAIVGVAGEEDDDGNAANDLPVATKAAPKAPPLPKMSAADSKKAMDDMLLDLDGCATKENLQEWALRNSKKKGELWEEHQGEVTQAFQKAQTRIREAAQ